MDEKINNNTSYHEHYHEHGDDNPISVTVLPPKRAHSPAPIVGTSSSAVKWNQHPVIATVLWILGSTENGISPTSMGRGHSESESSGSSTGKLGVLWKDEHGGNIVEFVSQVQRSGEQMDNMGTQLYPRSLEEQRRRQNQQEGNGDEIIDASPSPQWGFYIPITPPQQEMFSVIKRDLMSIQSSQRTNVAGGPAGGSKRS